MTRRRRPRNLLAALALAGISLLPAGGLQAAPRDTGPERTATRSSTADGTSLGIFRFFEAIWRSVVDSLSGAKIEGDG